MNSCKEINLDNVIIQMKNLKVQNGDILIIRFDIDKIYSQYAYELSRNIEKYIYDIYKKRVKVLMLPQIVDIKKEGKEDEYF